MLIYVCKNAKFTLYALFLAQVRMYLMDVNESYKTFVEKFLMPLNLKPTVYSVLKEFVDIDVHADDLAKILDKNQYYKYMLESNIMSMGVFKQMQEMPQINALIVLLGMQNVRNFICGLYMLRAIKNDHPKIKDGKLDFKPTDYLKYSLKAEEYCLASDIGYADTAFAAGFLFDIIFNVAVDTFKCSKKIQSYMDDIFQHGIKTAHLSWALGSKFNNFEYQKFTFAAGLLHDIGKIPLAVFHPETAQPSYIRFQEDMAKKKLGVRLINFLEVPHFGFNHEILGSQMSFTYNLLRPLDRSILNHHHPFYAKNLKASKYIFSSLVSLASNMANNFKVPDKQEEASMIASWKGADLAEFKIPTDAVIKSIREVAKVSG